jgi:hypothetical protein
MPSRFEQRFQRSAIPMLNREFAVDVVFSQGVLSTEAFKARRSDWNYASNGNEYSMAIEITMRDFYLPVESLVIDGEQVTPKIGNLITEGTDIFEIMPLDDRQSFELLPGGYEYLVHTKRKSK